jgi:GNAT superfamily N-acetyltransferase
MDQYQVAEVVDRCLQAWSLYRPGVLRVRRFADGALAVSCWRGEFLSEEVEGFSLNVAENGICYLLDIKLQEKHRGQGYGDALYKILEEVARELGCSQIRQTPSGWTRTGETRKDYLMRRGWLNGGIEVFKELV